MQGFRAQKRSASRRRDDDLRWLVRDWRMPPVAFMTGHPARKLVRQEFAADAGPAR